MRKSRSKKQSIKFASKPIKARRKLTWWYSKARAQVFITLLLKNQSKYRKATGGYRMDTRQELGDQGGRSEAIGLSIEKDRHPYGQGFLNVRSISVTYDQIRAGEFMQICQDYWAQEEAELAAWKAT